jgi:hypothetical protein
MKLWFVACLGLVFAISSGTAWSYQPNGGAVPKARPLPPALASVPNGPDTVEVDLQIWQVFGDEQRALKEAGFREVGGLLRLGGGDERKHNGVPNTVDRQLQLLRPHAERLTGVMSPGIKLRLGRVAGLQMGLGVTNNQLSYLVRTGEKTFELQHLSADAQNTLGLKIDLTPRAVPSDPELINIAPLKISFTTVDGREPIPGVDLEIGKPVISTRTLETSFTLVDGGDAIGIVLPGPEGRQPILFLTVHRVAAAQPSAATRGLATPGSFAKGLK